MSWVCLLGIEKAYCHPTISVFIDRIGGDGFSETFNHSLPQLGPLSEQLHVDSWLLRANPALQHLFPSEYTIYEIREKELAENGLLVLE